MGGADKAHQAWRLPPGAEGICCFPRCWLKAEAEVEASRTTVRGQQDGQNVVLRPVESAARRAQPQGGPPTARRATVAGHTDQGGSYVILASAAGSRFPRQRRLNCSQRIRLAGIPSCRKPLESAVIMAGGARMETEESGSP